MGIFSSDEEPMWSDIFALQDNIKRLQEENEKLKAENKQLKKPCLVMPKVNQLAVPIDKYEKLYKALEEIREIINEQKPPLDKAISQSEFTLERLCDYEEKYIKVLNKINEALNDRN